MALNVTHDTKANANKALELCGFSSLKTRRAICNFLLLLQNKSTDRIQRLCLDVEYAIISGKYCLKQGILNTVGLKTLLS